MHKMNSFGISNQTCEKKKEKEKKNTIIWWWGEKRAIVWEGIKEREYFHHNVAHTLDSNIYCFRLKRLGCGCGCVWVCLRELWAQWRPHRLSEAAIKNWS